MNARRILLSSPDVGSSEEEMLVEAVRSGWIAPLGPMVDAFETEIATRCSRSHAVALVSGTAALHLALLEAGAKPDTAVVIPTMTFAATAYAAVYTGAAPVFVDCELQTGTLDPELLEQALISLQREGQAVAAVVPVDLLGRCADYSALVPICETAGIPIVADAAESLGSSHHDRPAGSFGVTAALSFNGNKIMTTSGGGMLLTDDTRIADRARYLSAQARQPKAHYEHTEIGFNYRMSNLLAAVGRAQLRRLDGMIERRRTLRQHYAALFARHRGVSLLQRHGDSADNCWLTAVLIDPEITGWNASDLAESLDRADIETRPLWKPMHRQPVFHRRRAFLSGAADRLFATGLALPSGSSLDEGDVGRVSEAIAAYLDRLP